MDYADHPLVPVPEGEVFVRKIKKERNYLSTVIQAVLKPNITFYNFNLTFSQF